MNTDTVSLIKDPAFRRTALFAFAKGMGLVTLLFILLFGWMFLRAEDTVARWEGRFPAKTVTLQTFQLPRAGLSEADLITPDDTPADGPATPDVTKKGSAFDTFKKAVPLAEGQTRLAIVLSNIGLSTRFSETVIDTLPASVTLGFSPYASDLSRLKKQADGKAFESWLMIPLEPADYPSEDPGPMTVLTNASLDAIQDHVGRLMDLGKTGYPGFITYPGHVFTQADLKTNPMMRMIAEQGFGIAEGKSGGQVFARDYAKKNDIPYAQAGEWLTRNMGRSDIETVLQRVEKLSQMNGRAVLMVEATPLSLTILQEWLDKLPGRNIQPVPLSALAQ